MPVGTRIAEIWKNYILFFTFWESLFSSLNRNDWYLFALYSSCLCVSISFTLYYSIVRWRQWSFISRKHWRYLLTTLKMGKINNYLYCIFLRFKFTENVLPENVAFGISETLNFLGSMPLDSPRLGRLGRCNFSSQHAYTFKKSRYAKKRFLICWHKQYQKEQITEGKLGLLKKEILLV